MATAAGVGSGALSGAAAGTAIMPGWGTAAGAVIGGALGAMGGDGGAGQQQAIEGYNLQNAADQQQYAHQLNAVAMQRAIAGSTDAQGSTIRYDPATNSWVSSLGAIPARQQAALSAADYQHNTVDVPQASQNNAASSIQASLARRGMSGALNSLNSYTPISQAALLGALQDSSTRANQITQNPIIQDAITNATRTGSATGPILAQLQRASSDSLSKEMSDNVIKSMTGAADVNNATRQSLSTPISTLQQAGTPFQQNTQGSYTPGPSSELAAQVNGRAAASGQPASMGSAYSAYGTSAGTQAAAGASGVAMNSPVPGQIAGMDKSLTNLSNSSAFKGIGTDVNNWWSGANASANQQIKDPYGATGFGQKIVGSNGMSGGGT